MWASEPSNAFRRADASGHGEQRLAGESFPRRQKRKRPHPRLFWNAAETLESGAPVVLTLLETSAESRTEFILTLLRAQSHSNRSQRGFDYFQLAFET
jgi:hypothetical protein